MAALTFARNCSGSLSVPQTAAPTLPVNSGDFETTANEIIAAANQIGDSIVATTLDGTVPTFDSCIEPLASWANWAALKWYPIECAKEFSPSKKVVDDATAAQALYDQALVRFQMREDVWKVIDTYLKSISGPSGTDPKLTTVQERLLKREHRIRCDLGLDVADPAARARLAEIETEVASLLALYYAAIKDRDLGIWFTPEELDGVTPEFLKTYKRDDDGRYFVTFAINDIFTLTRLANNAETRERILSDDAYKWDNAEIQLDDGRRLTLLEAFHRVLQLKNEAARLKGFPNTAALKANRSMAKFPSVIQTFITEFVEALSGPAKQHVSDLLEIKKRDYQERQIDAQDVDTFYHWDGAYYIGKLNETREQIDRELVREYFPVNHVLPQLFNWVEDTFGLIIADIPEGAPAPAAAPWDAAVRLFGVWSARDRLPNECARFVGYLYLDLFDRDNKQNQPTVEMLQPAITVEGVEYPPAVILALDLKRPAEDWPALMYQYDVQELFRNIPGTIARLVGTKSGYAELSAVRSKYPEYQTVLPNAFARLAGDGKMLSRLSKHYTYILPEYEELWQAQEKNQGKELPDCETLPEDLAKRIEENQYAGQAQPSLRQIRYAQFDHIVNSCNSPEELQNLDLQREYFNATDKIVAARGRESKPTVNQQDPDAWRVIGHMYLGIPQFLSSAGTMYRYMYSQALAEHAFKIFFPDGPFAPGIEDRFVNTYLSKAGIVDPINALEEVTDDDLSTRLFFERVRNATS